MTWAKLTGNAGISHFASGLIPGPSADFWGQVDVWIPPNTFTACGEDGNHNLFGSTAAFLDFGNDDIQAHNVGTALAPDWRWRTAYGNVAVNGPTPGATHTIKFHYTSGKRFASGHTDWYVDGVLVVSDTGVNNFAQSSLFLNHFSEGCCCETYYYTNVKLGLTDGGSDIFASDFSEGLGFWTRNQVFMPSSLALVDAPAAAPCPTLTITPPRGLPGDTITLNGTGFAPDSPLGFWVNNNGKSILIESFSAASDGSGNVHATTTVPHILTTGSGGPDFVALLDAEGNIGCATLGFCGTRGADGITTAPEPVVATGGLTDTNNLILDYIFHDGAHWVLWQDTSQTGGLGSTFPPPANHTMNATRVSADGSEVTDYPIDTGYRWMFDSGAVSDPGLFATRPCPDGGGTVNAPVWDAKFYFAGWAKPIYDARFASDGTSLWVGVVTRETVPYPWVDNQDACDLNPGSASQFVPLATLTSGFTSFATSVGAGYHRYNTQTLGVIDFYQPNAYPVTDAGEENSGYWSPPVAVVFAFDGSAFNRIGDIDALYCPGETQSFGNPPGATQVAPRGSLFSRISMCASPTDPGVCHVVWSEGGDWGRRGQATSGCASLVWDAGPTSRDYRVNYTTWSPTAKLADTDLFHSHQDRTAWSFPNDAGGSIVLNIGYTWPPQANFACTPFHDLRNDNPAGTPYLFLAWPQSFASGVMDGFYPPSGPDSHGNPWLDNYLFYCDTLHVYDLGSGGAVLARTLDVSLFPDEAEVENFWPLQAEGFQAPEASDCLYAPQTTAVLADLDPQDKSFGISLPYDDPELGVPVYLVHVPLTRRLTGWWQPAPNNQAVGGPNVAMRAFYRVPCDMSAGFDFLDGDRQLDFTVIKEPFGDPFSGFRGFFYSSDFFSDEKNIWVPAPAGPFGAGYFGEWFDRVCNNEWRELSAAWTPPVASYWLGAQCHGFRYDPASDSITTVAASSGLPSPGDPLFAVTTQFLCRGCRHCKCGTGIHLAHRF